MTALRDRVAGLGGARVDALLAVAIVVELELECWLHRGIPASQRFVTALAIALLAAPVAFRRRWPAGALVFASAIPTLQALAGGDLKASNGVGVMLALAVLAYSAGAWLELRRGAVAAALGAGVFSGFVLLSSSSSSGGIGAELFIVVLVYAAPWLLGRAARERARRAAAFQALAVQTAAEHEQRERGAIAQERARIGRELQDIVAHSVSAMTIQAGGARRLLRSDPERARDSILTVEQTGREALADLRRLLGMLRRDEDPRALAPQPGLDQLATLLDTMRDAGLSCELRSEGEPVDLTPGIDLVGYRAIEAALACAVRHRCRAAVVAVRYRRDALELEVRGERSIPDLERELLGMSERVALYDGSLRALPAAGERFALRTRLPLGAAVPA